MGAASREIAVPKFDPSVLCQTLCRPAFRRGGCRRGLSCLTPLPPLRSRSSTDSSATVCTRICAPLERSANDVMSMGRPFRRRSELVETVGKYRNRTAIWTALRLGICVGRVIKSTRFARCLERFSCTKTTAVRQDRLQPGQRLDDLLNNGEPVYRRSPCDVTFQCTWMAGIESSSRSRTVATSRLCCMSCS